MDKSGRKVSDEQIKEWLSEGDSFPYGYRKLTVCLKKVFGDIVEELGMVHERIPVKTPNMNAHIESFHAILEDECYSRYEFSSFMEVYATITEYMRYYNKRRRHGSIKYMALNKFYEVFMSNTVNIEAFSA